MSDKIIVTCAVTGAGDNFKANPAVPVTPKQIAEAALEAGRAGAAIAHIHVRDPETGMAACDISLYREVVDRIRDRDEKLIIELTCGDGAIYVPGDPDPAIAGPGTNFRSAGARVAHVEALRPDMCTLDLGTFNYGKVIFANPNDHVREMARRVRAVGTKPDLEIFELGDAWFACQLVEEQLLAEPVSAQVLVGYKWAAPASIKAMLAILDILPPGIHWSAAAGGDLQFGTATQSVLLGGSARVGLEDSIYIEPGVLAKSNAQQVEKVIGMAGMLAKEPATADEARAILGLRPTNADPHPEAGN